MRPTLRPPLTGKLMPRLTIDRGGAKRGVTIERGATVERSTAVSSVSFFLVVGRDCIARIVAALARVAIYNDNPL